jgi:hypothetical protein
VEAKLKKSSQIILIAETAPHRRIVIAPTKVAANP